MTEWVRVVDGLPEAGQFVLAYIQETDEMLTVCYLPDRSDVAQVEAVGHLNGITYWRAMPDRPPVIAFVMRD